MAAQLYRTLTGQSQKSDSGASAPPPLTRTTTTDPVTGSLNHLSPAQLELLDQFKDRLQKEGWWSPDGVNGKPTHDDGTLLRYLRARKFDIDGAVGQFTDTEKWMKEQRVEELYEHYDVDLYEKARLMYPQWTGHRDKRGIPIYVFVIKGLDSKTVNKYQKDAEKYKASLPNHKNLSTPAKLLPLFALYHNLLNFVLPMASSLERPNPEIPVTNSTNIVDITGVGLTQFWNLKQHMQDASVLATAHYPETLDRIFIIGAPAFFPTVWGWIKRWFDPVTVSKIFILSKHEVKPTLSKFMDTKDFPIKYGGELDWNWGDLPHMDKDSDEAVSSDGKKGWIPGPCLWLNHQRIVVGSENGKLRRSDKEVAAMKPVVYAADYTEEPVHPERRGSHASGRSTPKANGSIKSPKGHSKSTSTTSATKMSEPPITAAAAVASNERSPTEPSKPTSRPTTAEKYNTEHIPKDNLRSAPMDQAPLHLPDHQPAFPAKTAEYISPVPSAQEPSSTKISEPKPTETSTLPPPAASVPPPPPPPTSEPSPITSAQISPKSTSPPPPTGMTQPGPLPQHAIAMASSIASKMEGESLSTIPATANGDLPHPEIVMASDKSKGLAMDVEKLELGKSVNGNANKKEMERPGVEKFVTAAEF